MKAALKSSVSAMAVLTKRNDKLYDERIVCTCRKADKPKVYRRAKTHRDVRIKLRGSVECVIEKEICFP